MWGENQHKTANMAEEGYSKIFSSLKAIKTWKNGQKQVFLKSGN